MKEVSIGTVKRDISQLVNQVAFGGERIILTSRGKPKAAFVSIEDFHRLQNTPKEGRWQRWLSDAARFDEQIMAGRQGQPIDVDRLWDQEREEQEQRLEQLRSD
ncbi:MAG: type II toxin-antitoxin system Phd/YefM family antitoxin [Vulcanimicrobiota bacterium]